MKEYKLIETYPDSPKLGTIVFYREIFQDYASRPLLINFKVNTIENNPKFWELVKQKNYEIISLMVFDEIILFSEAKKHIEGQCTNGLDLIQYNGWLINSVKRLSDGEIFTVGDFGKTINSRHSYSHKITSIELMTKSDRNGPFGDELIWVNWEIDSGGNWLDSIEKVITPLFVTNDKVKIFTGDKYWFIFPDYTISKCDSANGVMNGALATFSNEVSANEWVLLNYPGLSINDISKVYATAKDGFRQANMSYGKQSQKLRDMMKNKLKELK